MEAPGRAATWKRCACAKPARAGQRNPYGSRDPYATGSLASKKSVSRWFKGNSKVNEEDEFEDH